MERINNSIKAFCSQHKIKYKRFRRKDDHQYYVTLFFERFCFFVFASLCCFPFVQRSREIERKTKDLLGVLNKSIVFQYLNTTLLKMLFKNVSFQRICCGMFFKRLDTLQSMGKELVLFSNILICFVFFVVG